MQFDRTAGHEDLEQSHSRAGARDDWQARAAVIRLAATCGIHGCCDGETAEEYERWDGMN